MLMAILLVTVFVVEADTAVDTTAVPVTAGAVIVKSLAVFGAAIVVDPPPVDFMVIGILYHRPSASRRNGYSHTTIDCYRSKCSSVI